MIENYMYKVKKIKNRFLLKNIDIKEWVNSVLSDLNKAEHTLSILFTDDNEIKKLNSLYRKKNYSTDVLSFSQTEGETPVNSEVEKFLGDIVISVDTAVRQSEKNTFENEIKFLILHGILHLLGYDHEKDSGQMEVLEYDIFNKLTGVKIGEDFRQIV